MDEDYLVRCEVCGERFKNTEGLEAHIRRMNEFRDGEITWEEYLEGDDG